MTYDFVNYIDTVGNEESFYSKVVDSNFIGKYRLFLIRNIKGTRCIKIENEKKKKKHLILVLAKVDIFPQDFINSKINLLKKENNIVLVVSS